MTADEYQRDAIASAYSDETPCPVDAAGTFTDGLAATRDSGSQRRKAMGFTAVAGSGNAFKRVPQGVWIARCIRIIDLGTQRVEFQGDVKLQHKLQIMWEVLGEDENGVPLTVEVDGRDVPMTISKRYTLSLHEKARLRADLEAWRGKPFAPEELKGFDVSKLLGAYCMVNVVESETNGKTYSNISSITPLPRELTKHKPISETPLQSFDVDQPDMAQFESFHDKLKETIQASAEWQQRTAKLTGQPAAKQTAAPAGTAFDDMDSDMPF